MIGPGDMARWDQHLAGAHDALERSVDALIAARRRGEPWAEEAIELITRGLEDALRLKLPLEEGTFLATALNRLREP